jgi:hypothetical protein
MGAAQAGAAGYITSWQPSSVTAAAAGFARAVVAAAIPRSRERAKSLLRAAAKLADYGLGLGLEPVPEVLLHPSVIERFTVHAPGLTGVTRRTLRTNLRFIARKVVPQLCPAGLVCPGAGAGLIRSDLRHVRGADVLRRSGGVIVSVRGARPRAVPVLARYRQPLLASAAFAGECLVTGGTGPDRGNIANPLVSALADGTGLPRLDTSRLRATWLADCAERLGLATFLHAAGITCSQRLGDIIATLQPGTETEAVALLGVSIPVAVLEAIIDDSGVARRIEVLQRCRRRGRPQDTRRRGRAVPAHVLGSDYPRGADYCGFLPQNEHLQSIFAQ